MMCSLFFTCKIVIIWEINLITNLCGGRVASVYIMLQPARWIIDLHCYLEGVDKSCYHLDASVTFNDSYSQLTWINRLAVKCPVWCWFWTCIDMQICTTQSFLSCLAWCVAITYFEIDVFSNVWLYFLFFLSQNVDFLLNHLLWVLVLWCMSC